MKNNNDNGKSANNIRTHCVFKLNDAFICSSEIEHTKCKMLKIEQQKQKKRMKSKQCAGALYN